MKKLILSLLLAIISAVAAHAQYDGVLKNHYIYVSVNDNLALTMKGLVDQGPFKEYFNTYPYRITDKKSRGSFSLGYYYMLKTNFAVGADFTFESAKMSLKHPTIDKVMKERSINLGVALAVAQLKYYKKGAVMINGRVGLGAMTNFDGKTYFAYQIDVLDVNIGSDRISGFLRLGYGVKGISSIGVRLGF